MQLPTLRGPRVMLRPLGPEDVRRIAELGSAPEVARWWPGIDEAYVRDELLPDRESPSFAIVADGEVAGLIQFWEENDPEYRHAGMDLFLGVPWQGRGLGPEALWLLAGWLLSERGHHRLTIDPATANEPAIRAYRKLGFRPVGVLRQYERDGEGWRDGLLMDLLADELREP
jgi:aminoglycoside 6'-N-acetyltransferase